MISDFLSGNDDSSLIFFFFTFCLIQITTVEEAKEFYPLFGLGANVALIFSGRTVKYFSNLRKNLGPGVDGWAISLKGMMSIVVLLGLVICAIYWGVNTFVVNDPSVPRSTRKKKVLIKVAPLFSLYTCFFILLTIQHIYFLGKTKTRYGRELEGFAFF